MKRHLALSGGAATLLILAACGSTTTITGGSTSPTATATATAIPTPVPTQAPTPTPAGTPKPTPVPATGATVTLRSVTGFGQILVGPNGRTLYLFLADSGVMSRCAGSCAQNWPPLTTAGLPRGAGGVSQGLLGTTRRGNGTTQVTYNGHPLYYFIADAGPGTAGGEGINAFGARWEVVDAAGAGR